MDEKRCVAQNSAMSRTISVHQAHELILRLEGKGFTKELAQKIITNSALAKRVVVFVQQEGYEPTLSQKRAKEIMGRYFLGVPELVKCFGFYPNDEELFKIAEIPFRESTLKECSRDYMLCLGFPRDAENKPLTIKRLQTIFPRNGWPRFSSYHGWFDGQKLATNETPELRWYLMRRSIVEESMGKSFLKVQKICKEKENEYIERAVVYAFATLLLLKTTRESPFKNSNKSAWCIDNIERKPDIGGLRPHPTLGYDTKQGLGIGYASENFCDPSTGIIPVRKPDI